MMMMMMMMMMIALNRINLCAAGGGKARGSVRTALAEAGLRRSAEGKSDRQSPSHSIRMRRSENRSVNHALQWSEMQRLQRNRPAPLENDVSRAASGYFLS